MTDEPVRFDGVALQAVRLAELTPEPEWLSGAEKVRAERFATAELRRDFVARRTAVRIFAARLLGLDPAVLTSSYSCPEHGSGPGIDHGRPGFWANGNPLPISLSSSSRGGWLLLGGLLGLDGGLGLDSELGQRSEVGVDLERIDAVGFDGFDEMVLSEAEQQRLRAAPESGRNLVRARIWARKEAWSKAQGTGLRGRISEIDSQATGVLDIPNAVLGLPESFAAAYAVVTGLN